jgi:fumarate reductase subunit C
MSRDDRDDRGTTIKPAEQTGVQPSAGHAARPLVAGDPRERPAAGGRPGAAAGRPGAGPRRELFYEAVSGVSGLVLAVFMWGHVLLVGSILTGARGFDWLASTLEVYYIAQPTVIVIFALFLVHAVFASRKIPARLRERRVFQQLSADLRSSAGTGFKPHIESMLWIWQLRTGMVILVLGSFHLVLLGMDVLTPLFGEGRGIESATSLARVQAGLWLPYAILLVCVEFHASVGLYRLAVKWGAGALLSRQRLHTLERIIFWVVLGLGAVTLLVLAGVLAPPLEFLLPEVAG